MASLFWQPTTLCASTSPRVHSSATPLLLLHRPLDGLAHLDLDELTALQLYISTSTWYYSPLTPSGSPCATSGAASLSTRPPTCSTTFTAGSTHLDLLALVGVSLRRGCQPN